MSIGDHQNKAFDGIKHSQLIGKSNGCKVTGIEWAIEILQDVCLQPKKKKNVTHLFTYRQA